MLYLVSGDGSSLSEPERAAAVTAAWQVFGERDPREIYDAFRFGSDGHATADGQLWRNAEAAAIAAATHSRPRPKGALRLEVF
jgi:hypothetical protein